ncbi:calpain-like protease PalBory [Talaromyces stipitatus ATCC 10500]|uniref:Calpain-like protease PalBory n=1 Tax=Talaromyces stipitatus (strain ATCC 10500 / CBS 375.48 / QM 6759 / NRRL 1006) TaxID=441959 RepID=B8MH71_TALSN|nr:calpain-like protease PalBory [Talaromyces stipitatus ATCC 10500]EED16885.1 calpain-like protease PalBory [Talaromyces stipitatus ATCC 10500]
MSESTDKRTSNIHLDRAIKYERQVSDAGSQSQALEAAIAAADNYMRALKLADTPREKQWLDSKCKDWLCRAENIKLDKAWKPSSSQVENSLLKEPVSKRTLSTREEIILLESAKLNGFIFPPWKDDPSPHEFELVGEEGQFEDKTLRLSILQKEVFSGWKRPAELIKERGLGSLTSDEPKRVGTKVVMDLVQDITTDCSVIASICAVTARFERGYNCNRIFPFDYNQGIPRKSISGKYIFRLYFNGCYRKVVIDDRLPSSKTSRSLFAIDRNAPKSFWPALIEKAYLKLRGGYDFPGSNSGTDLWVLTGWIPEQIFLHHEDVAPDQLWRRIRGAFQYGDVVLTLGTGELNSREERLQGLIGRHDYAVLDLTERDGYRQMLIKNPWADSSARTPHSYSRPSAQNEVDTTSNTLLPGCFWMDYDQIFQNFDNMYLNWNPGLFTTRHDIHFTWDLSKARFSSACFANSPQFSISTVAGGPVWLLLSKHFRTTNATSPSVESGFISIYVSKKGGQRIFVSDDAFYRGPFVDSPNTLAKIDMEANSTYTVVVAEQSLPLVAQNFTLSALSRDEIMLKPAEDKFLHTYQMGSEWSPITAGGNTESPRYPSNPQHVLQVSDTADVLILLETPKPDLAVHSKLFWSDGKRVSTVRKRDIVTDSGHYRPGCVVAETEQLRPGSYTLVCSTFLPDQVAKFNIWVFSTTKCHVKALPSEAAGRLAVLSDVGILPPGIDRIFAPLSVPRLTRLKLIARSRNSTIGTRHITSSPMLMTVELGQGPYKEILASSENGEYSDAVSGIRVPDFDVCPEFAEKRGIWIVIERIGGPVGQVTDCVDVEALSEERVEIGEWITSS